MMFAGVTNLSGIRGGSTGLTDWLNKTGWFGSGLNPESAASAEDDVVTPSSDGAVGTSIPKEMIRSPASAKLVISAVAKEAVEARVALQLVIADSTKDEVIVYSQLVDL